MNDSSDNQYNSLESIFSEASNIPSGKQRDAFLERACGENHGLREKIQNLLKAHDQTESLNIDVDKACHPLDPTEQPGAKIGPYRLLEKIGEGGFGTVFMAEQQTPIRRKVALKILKLGMDTKQVVARFEVERQALALMDHPGIAKVYDAGATETGRPYFVMELVRGIPIDKFCDTGQLSFKERLSIIVQVCRAVEHAHSKGVLHRDLKPGNILVGTVDDKPAPKIIDFGIAKATETTLTDRTLFTHFSQLIGTPAYMSPEQAGQGPVNLDGRTDVYSLGVLLYETLIGVPPLDSDTLRKAGMDEIFRIIKETEPQKPSTRLSSMDAITLEKRARERGLSLGQLRQSVHGDLDWIVMKALEKDRTRRYRRASDLAQDLQHYLEDKPVTARPPTLTYRAHKFTRRHHRSLTIAAMIIVLGTLATAIALHFRHESTRLSGELETKTQDLQRVEEGVTELQDKYETTEAASKASLANLWLESARRLRDSGHLFESKLLAARTIGFEGFGRQEMPEDFIKSHPILAPLGTELRSEIESFLRTSPDYPVIWQTFPGDPEWRKSLEISELRAESSVAYAPDGRHAATVWQDGVIRLWDLKDGSLSQTVRIRDESPGTMLFSPSGKSILSGWKDGKVRQWHFASDEISIWDDAHESPITAISLFGHSGGTVTGDEKGWIKFRIEEGSMIGDPIQAIPRAVKTIAVNNSNTLVAIGGYAGQDQCAVSIFDVEKRALINEWTKDWNDRDGVMAACFRPWHAEIAVAVGHRVDILDLASGDFVMRLEFDTPQVHAIDISPDGRMLAVGMDGGIALCDLALDTRRILFTMKHTYSDSISFGPDGTTLLAGTDRGGIRMWEVSDHRLAWDRKGHYGIVTQCTFLENQQEIVTSSIDGTMVFWDLETGMLTRRLKVYPAHVRAFVFDPNGKWLVTTGGRAYETLVWDPETGAKLMNLGTNGVAAASMEFSPVSGLLALADQVGKVQIFDTKTFDLISIFRLGKNPLPDQHYWGSIPMAFDATGMHLICSAWDGIEIWDAPIGRLKTRNSPFIPGGFLFDPIKSMVLNVGTNVHAFRYPSLEPVSAPMMFTKEPSRPFMGAENRGYIQNNGRSIWMSGATDRSPESLVMEANNKLGPVSVSPDERWLACGLSDGSLRVWHTDALYDDRPNLASRLSAYIADNEGYRLNFWASIPLNPMAPDSILRDLRQDENEEELMFALFKRMVKAGNISSATLLSARLSETDKRKSVEQQVERLQTQIFKRNVSPPSRGSRLVPAIKMTAPTAPSSPLPQP